ncbi:energy-coupling factor transporter ATPase [Neobacillus sp. PS3-34]|uniref:ABC transporter ATP-binding protein n=1 Tax=Neobacillus sp. PS3-34 TaxID=3070678 RepID=UPI0027E19EFB|nr:energy-coupling factor transporter ATPase [Neobacillus sp. PS3-34]WML47166.1 energy-coupling factor transporter ATPase [Neobacillus sp. PS3-34]
MAFIELKNVFFTYPDAAEPAIRNLSLQVEKGQFIVLFGSSGSGKSTLLRLLKKEIMPHGDLSGEIMLNGNELLQTEGLSKDVGFVFQDPENQVVADDVLHEMAFGLENLGLSTNEMRSRIAEMVHYFGAESLLHRKTHELSGGKKQQINLASVLLMQPDILLLDEPTAQLDPVSAREFLDMLVRLNEEFGMTIILAEHRLEEVFTLADKIVMLEKGEVEIQGNPRQVLQALWDTPKKGYVPSIPSLYLSMMKERGSLPLTVKEGRSWTQDQNIIFKDKVPHSLKEGEEIIRAANVFYRYQRDTGMVLSDLDFSLHKGDFYALLGGNGSGKSTFLKVVAGLLKPERGKVFFHNTQLKALKNKNLVRAIGYLPQNPKLFFLQDTVEKEIQDTMKQWGLDDQNEAERLLEKLGIAHLRNSHPYDLSGGELQKAALACLLLRNPEILLLDEPTKGLDPLSKDSLASILNLLKEEGATIFMSTHDVEFAAQYASKCGMMFQGKITSEDVPENFFKGNFFYTTMVQRLFRHIPGNSIVTLEEAVQLCKAKE